MNWSAFLKKIIGLSCILLIGGCSTFQFAPNPPTLYATESYTPEKYKDDLVSYQKAVLTKSAADRKDYRDKIVYKIAGEIDKNYREFKSTFFGERAATETSLDIMQIGLSTAGSFAGGQTANLLAAISTGLAGSRLSFNKNFFKEKSPDLLLSRMDALRAKQWLQIYMKLKGSDDATYSLYEAERDLLAYYDKGSLQAAFQDVIAESGAAQQKADAEIKNQIEAQYGVFMGPPAQESDRKEIEGLYEAFKKLIPIEQESQAIKIVEEFKKLQPATLINPGGSNRSAVDNLGYLFGVARQAAYPEVRQALVTAFHKASQNE